LAAQIFPQAGKFENLIDRTILLNMQALLKRHHQSLTYKTPWLAYSGLEVAQNPNPVA